MCRKRLRPRHLNVNTECPLLPKFQDHVALHGRISDHRGLWHIRWAWVSRHSQFCHDSIVVCRLGGRFRFVGSWVSLLDHMIQFRRAAHLLPREIQRDASLCVAPFSLPPSNNRHCNLGIGRPASIVCIEVFSAVNCPQR